MIAHRVDYLVGHRTVQEFMSGLNAALLQPMSPPSQVGFGFGPADVPVKGVDEPGPVVDVSALQHAQQRDFGPEGPG
jgi:hypothetical protein